MTRPSFQVRTIHWWNLPVPLVTRKSSGVFQRVGWAWNQKAYLVNNLNEGWIAFVEDQTPENIDMFACEHCGAAMRITKQSALAEHFRSLQ